MRNVGERERDRSRARSKKAEVDSLADVVMQQTTYLLMCPSHCAQYAREDHCLLHGNSVVWISARTGRS